MEQRLKECFGRLQSSNRRLFSFGKRLRSTFSGLGFTVQLLIHTCKVDATAGSMVKSVSTREIYYHCMSIARRHKANFFSGLAEAFNAAIA